MTTDNPLREPASIGSQLLANFSAIWGFVVAPIYVVGFGLMMPYLLAGAPGPVSTLPVVPPTIGLALGVLGLLLSRCGASRRCLVPAVLGIVLNAVPIALAATLRALGDGLVLPWAW